MKHMPQTEQRAATVEDAISLVRDKNKPYYFPWNSIGKTGTEFRAYLKNKNIDCAGLRFMGSEGAIDSPLDDLIVWPEEAFTAFLEDRNIVPNV